MWFRKPGRFGKMAEKAERVGEASLLTLAGIVSLIERNAPVCVPFAIVEIK